MLKTNILQIFYRQSQNNKRLDSENRDCNGIATFQPSGSTEIFNTAKNQGLTQKPEGQKRERWT